MKYNVILIASPALYFNDCVDSRVVEYNIVWSGSVSYTDWHYIGPHKSIWRDLEWHSGQFGAPSPPSNNNREFCQMLLECIFNYTPGLMATLD